MKKLMLVALLILGFAASAGAADHATPDEAKTMAIKAADYLKANGPEKAFAAFKAADGGFRDRDLYVVVQDNKGNMVFHPIAAALIGKSVLDLKDVDGRPFNRDVRRSWTPPGRQQMAGSADQGGRAEKILCRQYRQLPGDGRRLRAVRLGPPPLSR